jgi:hypothetical protein
MIGSFIATVVLSGITAALIGLYLLPVLLGWARHVPDLGVIAVINILLGWTLVGWVVALALSLRSASPAVPVVQVFQQLPPSPLPPEAWWPGPSVPGPSASSPRRPDAAPPLILPLRPDEQPNHGEESEPQWPAQPW